jgi:hypothetical protein
MALIEGTYVDRGSLDGDVTQAASAARPSGQQQLPRRTGPRAYTPCLQGQMWR